MLLGNKQYHNSMNTVIYKWNHPYFQGVTKGARRKIVNSIEKLAERVELIKQMEKVIWLMIKACRILLSFVQTCLLELFR